MHEIITLQFGQQANYLATHFWNTQVYVTCSVPPLSNFYTYWANEVPLPLVSLKIGGQKQEKKKGIRRN